MAYFNKFPTINYNFAITGEQDLVINVVDILRRVQIINTDISTSGAFELYQCQDRETPETISQKYYGSPDYGWLILMLNNLFYGLESFPKSQYELETYLIYTYGETGKYDVHHYEDSNGNEVNAIVSGNNLQVFNPVTLVWDLIPISTFNAITNYEYEDTLNENKRNIYLLRNEFIQPVIREINKMLVE